MNSMVRGNHEHEKSNKVKNPFFSIHFFCLLSLRRNQLFQSLFHTVLLSYPFTIQYFYLFLIQCHVFFYSHTDATETNTFDSSEINTTEENELDRKIMNSTPNCRQIFYFFIYFAGNAVVAAIVNSSDENIECKIFEYDL